LSKRCKNIKILKLVGEEEGEGGEEGDLKLLDQVQPCLTTLSHLAKRQTARWRASIHSWLTKLDGDSTNTPLKHCIFCHTKHIFGFKIEVCICSQKAILQ
jgi:hypothetical protein